MKHIAKIAAFTAIFLIINLILCGFMPPDNGSSLDMWRSYHQKDVYKRQAYCLIDTGPVEAEDALLYEMCIRDRPRPMRRLTWILAPVQGKTPAKRPSAMTH